MKIKFEFKSKKMSKAVIPAGNNIFRPNTSNPASRSDPFNYPALNRKDLMSMSAINWQQDAVYSKIGEQRPKTRDASANLTTADVDGKLIRHYKNVGAKPK
jgi:hypothetical protein